MSHIFTFQRYFPFWFSFSQRDKEGSFKNSNVTRFRDTKHNENSEKWHECKCIGTKTLLEYWPANSKQSHNRTAIGTRNRWVYTTSMIFLYDKFVYLRKKKPALKANTMINWYLFASRLFWKADHGYRVVWFGFQWIFFNGLVRNG